MVDSKSVSATKSAGIAGRAGTPNRVCASKSDGTAENPSTAKSAGTAGRVGSSKSVGTAGCASTAQVAVTATTSTRYALAASPGSTGIKKKGCKSARTCRKKKGGGGGGGEGSVY